ncbi:unnamed protein product [Peronospora effusa]|nr:unnamed protein product [Peronospora effusa]
MPATPTSPVANSNSPAKTPLSVQRPELSPRKRKFSITEVASPTSLDEWENNVVASIASALDMDCLEAVEPISFLATPASDLTVDELEILYRFLA